jgi:hypothetical protein
MQPLISDMVQEDPQKRPTINEVVTRFNAIHKKLGIMKLRSRAGRRGELFGLFRDFAHLFRSVKYSLQGIPAVPTR